MPYFMLKLRLRKLLVGTMMADYHKQVGLLMEEQLVNLKLITLDDIKNQNPDWPAYKNVLCMAPLILLALIRTMLAFGTNQ